MNTLKAISSNSDELRVSNYMILFGGSDLVGDYFTKNTNFRSNYTDVNAVMVDFEHGIDVDYLGNDSHNVIGVADWKTLRVDDKGVFVERVLNRRAEYVKYLEELISAGLIGTSSQAVAGSVSRTKSGEITNWPIQRDSLTLTPCEPRMLGENILTAAKSLSSIFPHSKSLATLAGVNFDDKIVSSADSVFDLKSAESFLRAKGLSRNESLVFVSKLKSFLSKKDNSTELRDIAELIKSQGLFR